MSASKTVPLKGPFHWAATDDARALSEALGHANCRFVGGAVRDSLIGREVKDVDLATTLPPEEVIERLKAAKIKPVPTGIKHGTVTAVFKNRHFEVTTLRHDVETFGRHAAVAFHDDWEADAARRDFTFNALYLSPDGEIFDYFGGEADLRAGRVRFIGDAATRIQEDALRILRLFRFHAWFGKGEIYKEGLDAVGKKLDMLDLLSPERIRDETFKLLGAPNPVPVIGVMAKTGVLDHVFEDFDFDWPRLERVVDFENHLGDVSAIRRLGAFLKLNSGDAKIVFHRFHLSNKEMKRLAAMTTYTLPARLEDKAIRRLIYKGGVEAFQDGLILNEGDLKNLKKALAFSEKTTIAKFPVSGNDLERKGIKPGIEMGRTLKKLEAKWVDSDFSLNKRALLDLV